MSARNAVALSAGQRRRAALLAMKVAPMPLAAPASRFDEEIGRRGFPPAEARRRAEPARAREGGRRPAADPGRRHGFPLAPAGGRRARGGGVRAGGPHLRPRHRHQDPPPGLHRAGPPRADSAAGLRTRPRRRAAQRPHPGPRRPLCTKDGYPYDGRAFRGSDPAGHPAAAKGSWVASPWAARLTLVGSKTSPTGPRYLAGAAETARRAAEVFRRRLGDERRRGQPGAGGGTHGGRRPQS